jgi:hypothetical protein
MVPIHGGSLRLAIQPTVKGHCADVLSLAESEVRDGLGHRDSEMIRHYYHMQQNEAKRQIDEIAFLGELVKDTKEPEDLADDDAKECGGPT